MKNLDRSRAVTMQVENAIRELEELIARRYPLATFEVGQGDDPAGTYLIATVDLDDPDDVMDLVIDRLLELQIDQSLPVYVLPLSRSQVAASADRTGL